MDISLDQYISNPMGKTNAVLNATTREMIRSDYSQRFDKLLVRENGKIDYKLYSDEKKNVYWAHIKVPSEVVPKFYYDVVLKFYTNAKVSDAGMDLSKYFVKFYSNDPAFVYTYAHVLRQNDLFIKELDSKMSKLAIKKAPKIKNPTDSIGYVKAIYFAYLAMKRKGIFNFTRFKAESTPIDLKRLISEIEDADSKIARREDEGKKVEKKNSKNQKPNNSSMNHTDTSPYAVQNTRTTKSIQSKHTVGSVKTIKSVKKK